VQRLARVRGEIVDGLLPRPSFRVHARVDDEAHRAPHLVRELAELRVRIGVHPQLRPERFGVESPAFDEGREAAEAAETGNVLELLGD
jgi:hypothetical protein